LATTTKSNSVAVRQALILAAGFGTRLGELTRDTPKALVEVQGKPMLYWVVDKLKRSGCERIVFNTHYHADLVRRAMHNYTDRFEIEMRESHEPEILGTGGAVAAAQDALEEQDFWILNCDVWSDFVPYWPANKDPDAVARMILRRDAQAVQYGSFCAERGQVVKFLDEVPAPDQPRGVNCDLMFTGQHWVSPEIFQWVRPEFGSIIDQFYRPVFRAGKRIEAEVHKGLWIDVGTPEQLEYANSLA
jgi:mannose-1-phosphate guanylyltransferase